MKLLKYKSGLSALLAATLIVGSPASILANQTVDTSDIQLATEEDSEKDITAVDIDVNANYYPSETDGAYSVIFTVMDEIPELKSLSFVVKYTGAEVDKASMDSALGGTSEAIRKTDSVTYTLSFEEAKSISAKTRFCTLTVENAEAPTTESLTITDFKAVKADETEFNINASITIEEGPIVPELDKDAQAAYDAILDLPQMSSISFYDEDWNMIDISVLSKQYEKTLEKYEAVSSDEQEDIGEVLEYNGYSKTLLTDFGAMINGMNNAKGIIEIAQTSKDLDSLNALQYQFLIDVFNKKKAYVKTDGLTDSLKKECTDTIQMLAEAGTVVDSVYEEADYPDRAEACKKQIQIVQSLSTHKYYEDYLSTLKSNVNNLIEDVEKNYDNATYKKYVLAELDEALSSIEMIEKGIDDIPTVTLSNVYYKKSFDVDLERKNTLEGDQKASVTVTVTDKKDKELATKTKTFDNDSKTLNISLFCDTNYPKDDMVYINVVYNLNGTEYDLGTIEKKCSVTASISTSTSNIGIPSTRPSTSGNKTETESTGGSTLFPTLKENDDSDTNEESDIEDLFGDIGKYTWAHEAIEGLYYAGIINGMEEGVFNPAGNVTREQFSKMVVQLFELSTGSTKTDFLDVNPTAWYAPYVKAALDAGYVQGESKEYFGIGVPIMRQDMAVILYRALGSQNKAVSIDFTDKDNIAPYAEEAIAELVGLGAINGYEDNSFKPRGTATRAEAAKMIWSIYKFINE